MTETVFFCAQLGSKILKGTMGCQKMIYLNCSLVILVDVQLWSYLKKSLINLATRQLTEKSRIWTEENELEVVV